MNMNDFIEVLQQKNVPYAIDGDKIVAHGSLDLHHTSITSLPDNLSVDGSLNVAGTSITHLPKNLSVGGGFDLLYTGISSLPYTLKVGGFLHLHPEKITNIAWRKFWEHGDYTVFAAWINGGLCIVDNAHIYTLERFFGRTLTTDVVKAARECVAELTQRWKGTGGSTTWINVSDSLPELDTPVFGGWFSDSGDFILGCYVRTRFANATDWVWATAEDFGKGDWLFGEDNPVKYWMPLPGKPELVGGAA